jgi:hypothetical protein
LQASGLNEVTDVVHHAHGPVRVGFGHCDPRGESLVRGRVSRKARGRRDPALFCCVMDERTTVERGSAVYSGGQTSSGVDELE